MGPGKRCKRPDKACTKVGRRTKESRAKPAVQGRRHRQKIRTACQGTRAGPEAVAAGEDADAAVEGGEIWPTLQTLSSRRAMRRAKVSIMGAKQKSAR